MVLDVLLQRAYFGFNLLGGAAMILLLLTLAIPGSNPLFSRSRVATLTSLCFSRLVSIVFSCLLLFSGTVTGRRPPPNSLCIAQAALIVSTKSPLLSFTTFAFVLYLWILVSTRDPDRHLTTSSNIALVIFPYFFWTFFVVGSLALALQKQTNVVRGTFYCTINDKDRILTKTTSTISAVVYLLALVFLLSVLALFHKRQPSLHNPQPPFKGHINIRLGILALYCLLFAGLAISDALNYTRPVMDILRALDGLLIYGILGSQRWIIGTWAGWFRISPSSNPIDRPRGHRSSSRQMRPTPSPIVFGDSMASRHSTPRQIVSQVFRSTGHSGKAAKLLGFDGLASDSAPESAEDAQIRQWEEETASQRFRALSIALGLTAPSPQSAAELALGKHTPWRNTRTTTTPPVPPARHESPFVHEFGSEHDLGSVVLQNDSDSIDFSNTGMSNIGIALGGSDVTPSPFPYSPHTEGDILTSEDKSSPIYELRPSSHTHRPASDFVDLDPPVANPDETHIRAVPSLLSPEDADPAQPVRQSVLYVHSQHHSPRNSAFASSVSHEQRLSESGGDNEPEQGSQSRRSSYLPISMRSGSSSKSGSKGSKGSRLRLSSHSIEHGKHDDLPAIEVNAQEDVPPLPSACENNRLDTVVERSPQTSVAQSNLPVTEPNQDTPARREHLRRETSFYSFSSTASAELLPQPALPSNQITPAGSVIVVIPEVDPEPIDDSDPYLRLHSPPPDFREHPFSPIATVQRELSSPTHLDIDVGDRLSRRISPRAQHYANQIHLNPLNEPEEASPSRGQFQSMGVLQEEPRAQESAEEGLSRRPSFRIRRKPVPSFAGPQ